MKRKVFCDLTKTTTGRKSLKKRLPYLAILFVVFLLLPLFFDSSVAYADDGKTEEEIRKELSDAVNGAIDSLDLKDLQKFLDNLSGDGKTALNASDVKQMLKSLANGESVDFYESFFNFLSKTAGRYFLSFLPGLITILAICLLKNILCGVTGDFLNNSTSEVVHTVC